MNAVLISLQGATPGSAQSDASGNFVFNNLSASNWKIQPSKTGDLGAGISSLDASYVLQSTVGLRTLSPEQRLACDVTGNGSISALDASMILQYKVGMITQFPVTTSCGSDWAFIPQPAVVVNQVMTEPLLVSGTCQQGAISYQPLASIADNQNFAAVLFGDCTGNWQPPGALVAPLASGTNAASVELGRPMRQKTRVRIPVIVRAPGGFHTLDLQMNYDPAKLTLRSVHRARGARHALAAANVTQPGRLLVALASGQPLRGGSTLILDFDTTKHHASVASLRVTQATVGEN